MDSLPPDPYKALGVAKDADLSAIRSAHRKLVLKCHPDKVQDPQLKAVKQDEFQTVQQAYELLSDEKRRTAYDEKIKLFELRKEMGRSGGSSRTDPFQYEVRTAEPRTSSTTYTRQPVYTTTPPRSYEDIPYADSSRGVPRKTSSYESERKRTSVRDDDRDRERRRYEDEVRAREKSDRKAEKISHSDKKKSRDKERRRGTEEKTRSRVANAYVEDDSSEDDYRGPRYEKKSSSKRRSEEEMRLREEAARQEGIREERERTLRQMERERQQKERERASIRPAELDPKWNNHMGQAAQYIQAANRRGDSSGHMEHPGMRRAETFSAAPSQKYRVSYAANIQPLSDEEDSPRRSSGRRESRRASEAPISRQESLSREKSSKSSRRSPPQVHDPYIVEPPSPPPPSTRKPTLQTHSSAPPNLTSFARKEPVRSKTQDYPRAEKTPPLPRAATFAPGDRGRGGSSRLRQEVYSTDSDSDVPTYSPRRSSPPPQRKSAEPTRYNVVNGRTVLAAGRPSEHRPDLQESFDRDRSESPRGSSRQDRPSMARSSTERPRNIPIRSQSQAYYPPSAGASRADPIIVDAAPSRPKPTRENSRSNVHTSPRVSSSPGGAYIPSDVKYGPHYGHETVNYSSYPPTSGGDAYIRRGNEGVHVVHGHHHSGSREYHGYNTSRGGRQQVYA